MPGEPLFCPQCRSEFLPSASVCADCDVALVPDRELERAIEASLPPISELVCVRAASVGWARALSERLAAAGISHRIEVARDDEDEGSVRRPGANLPYGVYVRPEDGGAASEVDAEFMRSQIPDLPDASGAEGGEVDLETCPACETRVASSAEECPECGLSLVLA